MVSTIKNFSFLALIAVAVLLSNTATAQGTAKTLLWRISGHGLKKASYLLGTSDLICPGDYLWTKSMQDSFAKSDNVCFAADLGDSAITIQTIKMVRSNGKKLQDYFSVVEYPVVKAYAKDSLHLDLDKAEHLKPIALQPVIVKKLLGCSDAITNDARILQAAKQAGKTITGLESVDEESAEIDETGYNEKIVKTLTEMANGSTYYRDYRNKLMRYYQQQDIQAMQDLFQTNTLISPEIAKVLIDKRCNRWALRMPAIMQRSSAFFALSAIDLAGDAGLISLLRKAGYKVEAVM